MVNDNSDSNDIEAQGGKSVDYHGKELIGYSAMDQPEGRIGSGGGGRFGDQFDDEESPKKKKKKKDKKKKNKNKKGKNNDNRFKDEHDDDDGDRKRNPLFCCCVSFCCCLLIVVLGFVVLYVARTQFGKTWGDPYLEGTFLDTNEKDDGSSFNDAQVLTYPPDVEADSSSTTEDNAEPFEDVYQPVSTMLYSSVYYSLEPDKGIAPNEDNVEEVLLVTDPFLDLSLQQSKYSNEYRSIKNTLAVSSSRRRRNLLEIGDVSNITNPVYYDPNLTHGQIRIDIDSEIVMINYTTMPTDQELMDCILKLNKNNYVSLFLWQLKSQNPVRTTVEVKWRKRDAPTIPNTQEEQIESTPQLSPTATAISDQEEEIRDDEAQEASDPADEESQQSQQQITPSSSENTDEVRFQAGSSSVTTAQSNAIEEPVWQLGASVNVTIIKLVLAESQKLRNITQADINDLQDAMDEYMDVELNFQANSNNLNVQTTIRTYDSNTVDMGGSRELTLVTLNAYTRISGYWDKSSTDTTMHNMINELDWKRAFVTILNNLQSGPPVDSNYWEYATSVAYNAGPIRPQELQLRSSMNVTIINPITSLTEPQTEVLSTDLEEIENMMDNYLDEQFLENDQGYLEFESKVLGSPQVNSVVMAGDRELIVVTLNTNTKISGFAPTQKPSKVAIRQSIENMDWKREFVTLLNDAGHSSYWGNTTNVAYKARRANVGAGSGERGSRHHYLRQ